MTPERFGSLLAWPDAETPGLWRYLPAAPSAQRNEVGRANVTVMEAGGMVILTIGARLGAEESELAVARKAIATKVGGAGAAIDLRPADASVTGASLRLLAADGTETELAKARPSNLPPYSAAFSAMLQGDQAKVVKEALPAGRVIVRYDLALSQRRVATAELSGRWEGSGTVDAALTRGELKLRTTAEAGASEALIKRVVEEAKTQAAASVMRLTATTGAAICAPGATRTGTFVEVTESEAAEESLQLQAGIAGWMN